MGVLLWVLKHGWRAVTEAHTIHWLLGWVFSPPAIVTAAVRYFGEDRIFALTVIFLLSSIVTAFVVVIVAGYRNRVTLEIGVGAPFDTYSESLHTKTHNIRVAVKNNSLSQRVTNCDLILENISGNLSKRCPVKVVGDLAVNAGAREFVGIADFDERINHKTPPPSKPGLITIHFPLNPLSSGKSYLDVGTYEMTFFSYWVQHRSMAISLSFDGQGRLPIFK